MTCNFGQDSVCISKMVGITGILQIAAAFLLLHQSQSASLISLPDEENPVKLVGLKPPTSSLPSPSFSTILMPDNHLSKLQGQGKSCARRFVTLLVKKDGCQPAVLRTRQCVGFTYSYHIYGGFNKSSVTENIATTVCTAEEWTPRSKVVTFICGRKFKRQKVYFAMPNRCGLKQKEDKRLVHIPPPAPAPPTPDC